MYSIKSISVLTGLGVETLRAWERRYQAVSPVRESGGHRTYTQHDLDKLTLLVQLTRQGHAISKISSLGIDELEQLLSGADQQSDENSLFAEQIVEALLNYKIDRCEQLLKRALISTEPLVYVRDILTPALIHVGQLWHEGSLNIAQEHMFSASVKRILLSMVNNMLRMSSHKSSMLFATPVGESHEFGLLMSCLLAAEQQYNCYYLGADVPGKDIVEAARRLGVDIVVLSILKSPSDPETLEDLNLILADLAGEDLQVWVAGRGVGFWARHNPERPDNSVLISNLDHFYQLAMQWQHDH